jgi:LysM repeat protein
MARLVEEVPLSDTDPDSVSEVDLGSPPSTEDESAAAVSDEESSDGENSNALSPVKTTSGDSESTSDANGNGTTSQENVGDGEDTQESQTGQGQSTSADAQGSPVVEESGTQLLSADGAPQLISHTVAQGETLYRIGLQYDQPWLAIAQANDLLYPDYITAGQVLLIPFDKTQTGEPQIDEAQTVQLETVSDGVADPVGIASHTVRLGDTLQSIATAYNISWIELAEANGITTPNQIYPGQILKIPTHIPGLSPEFSHEIAFGQTLYIISLIYGVPISSIAEANGLVPPYVIYAGQSLIIPRE